MSNIYIKDGKTLMPIDSEQLNVMEKIPNGVYTVVRTMRGYVLEEASPFIMPPKIYGDTEAMAARILNTYQDRPTSTGVILTGNSGTGKTLLAKCISTAGYENDIVTIVINEEYCGDDFNTFLQSIDQPAVIIFDEFEKVYGQYEQERLLTVLDGVFSQKKLFIMTCNNRGRINEHMINRPGRIFYSLHFESITEEFAKDYCRDNLVNKDNVEGVIALINKYRIFSFDMLQSVVEEMNRYNETAEQVVRLLNINNSY